MCSALGVCLLAAHGSRSAEGQERRRVDDYAGHAADISIWAGIAPLDDGDGRSEIRVWITTWAHTHGWVVTPARIHSYSNYRNDHSTEDDLDKLSLVGSRPLRRARTIFALFNTLRAFDRRSISCPMKDGTSAYVEARIDGEHFVFYSSNPHACDDPNAKAVNRAIDALVQATETHPYGMFAAPRPFTQRHAH